MAGTGASILIVDDHPENLLTLEAVLEPLGHRVVRAGSGEEALQRLLREDFALILLDVQMPGLDGFETAEFIKRRHKTRHVPIIFLTAYSKDSEQVFRGYSTGAVDYMFKPFDPEVLRSKVAVFLDLHEKSRALEESEQRFRAAFDHAPIGVALVDLELRWTQVNRSLCEMLGRAPDEMLGHPIDEIIQRGDRSATRQEADRMLAGEVSSLQVERRIVHGHGHAVSALIHVSLIRDAAGDPQHFVAQIEDLTARRRAERERLERLQEKTARAEAEAVADTIRKLQLVSDAALSHLALDELCTALLERITSIMGADTGVILLREPDAEIITLRAGIGFYADVRGISMPIGQGMGGRIVAARDVVVVPDAQQDDNVTQYLRDAGVRSVMGVPLISDGEVTGALHVGSRTLRDFTAEEISLLRLAGERAALAIEHARQYERDRGIVETLQRSLLPHRMPQMAGIAIAGRYLPGGAGADVGGDWYDALALGEGSLGLAMGDVVGHGLEAASLMGQLRNGLRAYALDGHGPAEVVERLDRLVQSLEPGRMATLLYLTVDATGTLVRFASAGHLPPLVVDPEGEARFLAQGGGLPIGVALGEAPEEAAAELPPGSTLVLYTDGLVERRDEGIDDGLGRLRAAVSAGPADPEALCDHVIEALLGDVQQRDDAAVLVMQTARLDARRLRLELPADPEVLGSVRHTLGRWLREAGASAEEGRDIEFACHEACSNAIEHAYHFGEASFDVEAQRDGAAISITIRDNGGWKQKTSTDRGRGISLMKALMDRVEVSPGPEGTEITMTRELGRNGH